MGQPRLMSRLPATFLVPLSLSLAACSSDSAAPDLGLADSGFIADAQTIDSGLKEDAGTIVDAGLAADSGTMDSSVADSGQEDQGTIVDAGPEDMGTMTPDAGAMPPSNLPVTRGGQFMGTTEKFNRYYTDPTWMPSQTIYVSRDGSGDGSSRSTPASARDGLAMAAAGSEVVFLSSSQPYQGCYELGSRQNGTYDQPIVLRGEKNSSGGIGVQIECCDSRRRTCINLEGANYVAVTGFEFVGGRYGIRAVGLGYAQAEHQVGIAMLDNIGRSQCADPFFTGQSDWVVIDSVLAEDAGDCDGHGIYLSNGSDWAIVRNSHLRNNYSSDFQINADPISTCQDVNIPYDDARCDGSALRGLGQGVSEYILVENNYFHNGYKARSSGPNFTSVRNSMVRNNVIGFYGRHGTSFWQETNNPNLGSSDNQILHNLFIGDNRRHVLQFVRNSDRNNVRNNLFLGLDEGDGGWTVNSRTILVETDSSITSSSFIGNYYVGGTFDGYSPNRSEHLQSRIDLAWFTNFPTDRERQLRNYRPSAMAPFINLLSNVPEAGSDASGRRRGNMVSAGPLEP